MSQELAANASQADKNSRALATDHLMADLGRRTASGGAIAIGAQVVKMALQLATLAVMARLLAPEDFGLVAMAATVTIFVGLFTDLGLSAATVQRRDIDQGTVSALFYINLAMGALVMLAAMAAAPLAAWFFDDERVSWIVMALALQIPFAAASAQHNALLQRGMRWVAIQWTGIAAQFAGAAVGIALAWRTDIGFWALVVQGWVTVPLGLVLVWLVCPWRPGRVTSWTGTRSALKFGLNLTGFNLLNYFSRNADDVLIGWAWGAASLGLYNRAYMLMMSPITQLNAPLAKVAIPALSRLAGHDERYRDAYRRIVQKLLLLSLPLVGLLIGTADWVIELLLGPGWEGAVAIFFWLGIAALYQPLSNAIGWLFITQDRTRELRQWGLFSCLITIASFLVGLPFGPVGVAASYALAGLFIKLPVLFWWAGGSGPVHSRMLWETLLTFLPLGVGTAAISLAIHPWLLSTVAAQAISITAVVCIVITLVACAAVPAYRNAINDLRQYT